MTHKQRKSIREIYFKIDKLYSHEEVVDFAQKIFIAKQDFDPKVFKWALDGIDKVLDYYSKRTLNKILVTDGEIKMSEIC